jgi:glycosyltransferase involved in cell wall biosynthesis
MEKLVDMIRSVPEAAVRLWCGASSGDIKVLEGDGEVRVVYEGRETTWSRAVYEKAVEVARILSIRPRLLRTVQDVLDIRHDAEDIFTDIIFGQVAAPKVLFVPAGISASGYYRAMIPSDLMREAGKIVSHFTLNLDLYKALRYDILWIQLVTAPTLIQIAKKAKEQGLKIVYDIDDRLDNIPDTNQAVNVYGTPEKQEEIREMMKLADVVTVSTAPLAFHVQRIYHPEEVRVLPNHLTANVIPRKHPSNPAFVRILWAGSPTHKHDLAIVAPALHDVLKRHAGKVRFTCFGERLPEALSDCYDYIDLQDPVDFDTYHDKLASIAADFAIAPLADNPFNESKSAIKALEYASAGYPMLLSPIGEYPAVVEAGLPAELVRNDGWGDALERMVARTREERDEIGRRATAWVMKNRCMGANRAAPWAEVVEDLMRQKALKEEASA